MPFRLIAITPETVSGEEIRRICRLLDAGFDYVHIRKPSLTETETEQFLSAIPDGYRQRLKLHDHFHLARAYGIGGIHLNGRNPMIPEGFNGSVSRSCHSLEELDGAKNFEYVFLSPIFDSICKHGYLSNFTENSIREARGLINADVIALGGITAEKIPIIRDWGFGGCAFLGYLSEAADGNRFNERIESIIKQTK